MPGAFKKYWIVSLACLCCACGERTVHINQPALPGADAAAVREITAWPAHFGFGKKADKATITKMDISIRPDGKGLPAGEGTAAEGAAVYAAKCAACHGDGHRAAGIKFTAPGLVYNPDSPQVKTIGNYWPYATTVFDYIRRSMPYNAPGSLTNSQVYALTAYLLCANRLFDSSSALNARSLPGISMPARNKFVRDDRRAGKEVK